MAPTATGRPTANRARRGALLLSVLVVLAGGWWLASSLLGSTRIERVVLDGDGPAGVRSVVAEVENGDLTIQAGDVDRVEITRTVRRGVVGPDHVERITGSTLELTADCPWLALGRCGVSYEVVVPEAVAAELRTSSGDLHVVGLSGDLLLRTSSGDVEVYGATGTVDAELASGDLVLTGVTGDVVARTSSGDVVAQQLQAASVTAEAASGDLDLHFAAPPDVVEVDVSSGDVTIVVPDGTAYAVDGESSSGDREVEVRTDPGSPHRVDLITSSGDATLVYDR